jgi:hypothetical protein
VGREGRCCVCASQGYPHPRSRDFRVALEHGPKITCGIVVHDLQLMTVYPPFKFRSEEHLVWPIRCVLRDISWVAS